METRLICLDWICTDALAGHKAVPFLTRLVGLFIADGKIEDRHIPGLSEQARIDLQDLGPTFIKAGQMMSVRPDVLPQATLDELTKLQDSVTAVATAEMTRRATGKVRKIRRSKVMACKVLTY